MFRLKCFRQSTTYDGRRQVTVAHHDTVAQYEHKPSVEYLAHYEKKETYLNQIS